MQPKQQRKSVWDLRQSQHITMEERIAGVATRGSYINKDQQNLSSSKASTLKSNDDLLHQHSQLLYVQLEARKISATGQHTREVGDQFGLLGYLNVLRSNTDLTSLSLGIDLLALGINVHSQDKLYPCFSSLWTEGKTKGELEFILPNYYIQQPPRLQLQHFTKVQEKSLFYIFYSAPNDKVQLYAANELCNRGWLYHKELQMWFTCVPNVEPIVKANTYEKGSYLFFNQSIWEVKRKDNFLLDYEMLEKRPQL